VSSGPLARYALTSYNYPASPETIQCLELLLGHEASFFAVPDSATIVAAGMTVAITSEPQDFETNFERYRVSAECLEGSASPPEALRLGRIQRIRVLESEEWIEPAVGEQPPGFIGRIQAYQHSGPPGSVTPEATAKCAVHDAVLISGTSGEVLVFCELFAYDISWSTDDAEIEDFARLRRAHEVTAG